MCEKTFTLKKNGPKAHSNKASAYILNGLNIEHPHNPKTKETPKAVHPQICWMNILASSKQILLIYKHTLFQARLTWTRMCTAVVIRMS